MDSDTKVDSNDEVMTSKKDAREGNYHSSLMLQSIWDCNKMICNTKLNTIHCGHCGGKWQKINSTKMTAHVLWIKNQHVSTCKSKKIPSEYLD